MNAFPVQTYPASAFPVTTLSSQTPVPFFAYAVHAFPV
jgi:hypothetical protein